MRRSLVDSIVRELRHASLAAALFVAIAPNLRSSNASASAGEATDAARMTAVTLDASRDAQGGGEITGIVKTAAAALRPIRVTMDQNVCGNDVPDESIVVNGAGGVANAVITVAGVKAAAAQASGVMNEKCRFSPRVQIVRPNAVITTSSADPILHTTNAQIDGGKTLFNVAVPIPGLKINKPVAGVGLVRLTCNTHPWMRGFIIVTDNAAAISGTDGSFSLKNVPAGTYDLSVWHETLKGARQRVVVTPGRASEVTFTLQ
jgi:carboxypeptidase family protein